LDPLVKVRILLPERGTLACIEMSKSVCAVILAAGSGTRFHSAVPKVLHPAAGVPLIQHVLSAVDDAGAGLVVVVVGTGRDQVAEAVHQLRPDAVLVDQPELNGTGDALRLCRQAIAAHDGPLLVLAGDAPLVRATTLADLVAGHVDGQAQVTLLTARVPDPTGYGRVIRDESGRFKAIVEQADAGVEVLKIDEVSSGVWCFDPEAIFDALDRIGNANAQGEYYLPDAANLISAEGGQVDTVAASDPAEIEGVNDRAQLAKAAGELRARKLSQLMAAGVTVEDPQTTYVDVGAEVGVDTILKPLTFVEGSTRIGKDCVIGPSVRMIDSVVADGAEVSFAVVRETKIGPGAMVGPFTSLRPGTELGPKAKAGSFVEMKGAVVGEGSKVPHLSYIGDAEIGAGVNLGAGTITANYNSETRAKSQTVVEDGAFTGSDTTLVAPVRLGANSGTGAGSVVTKDVGEGEIVVGVPARRLRKRKDLGTS
jgi:bifunctional UDP-N-acetylglucosamine pyrophosphorylase/glucosamine-1-phosphate N-acetyltransferase